MRIAFLTTEYPTEESFAGGLASYVHRTATALLAHGHDPEVFTLSREDGCLRHDSVVVHRVRDCHEVVERLASTRLLWRGVRRYSGYLDVGVPAWAAARALARRHREAPFDVVQATNYRALGVVAAWRPIAPLVTRLSTYEPLWRDAYRKPATRRQQQIERAEVLQMRWSADVYAPSRIIADTVRAAERIDVKVVDPPFWLTPLSPAKQEFDGIPAEDTYGLFFGSIGFLKGCDRLVNVLPGVFERNPQMRFVFMGPIRRGEGGRRFDEIIASKFAPYHGRVRVLPEQRPPALWRLVERARFVVLPSRIDNLSNACMEAMALRRLVIGTRGASFDDLIEHDVNGILVSQTDDAELAEAMERAWRMDPAKREGLGKLARDSLDRLRPNFTVPRLIEVFERVLARHDGRRGPPRGR